ncbi:single-stranded DNA-binding protein [Bradyrhizobium sp. Tv2a-2]|uniref:single-stranded DNA-binding protein n=1 Tax=Bradyrhizobium sp. Tv2a-2 TaxID=113395 RepID=UPI00040482DA|nr:single-stranded DNA-binding protein [Bradyrhizobium sp. Tv2a-2]
MIECAFFGALGRDAESKTSASGKPYLKLNVRVGDGDTCQWISVLAFDPDAIGVADKMVKGARVYIEGKLSLNEWTGTDGSKRNGLSVMSFHARLSQIGRNKKPKSDRQVASRYTGRRDLDLDDSIPF